ncbi:MAG: UDP-N-acetylmuramoyl-tripeptide--D-alanyl-D-alanine ligase [Robiginitomaculum sp.]|nr:MAG: UDP-N-acetylmuramoyl-tripeptide--D-alanyl-D-alanine ligase [Robiginitomaculum sp.]
MTEPLWTAMEIAAATGAALIDGNDWQANGISIDTRTLRPGDLFVALHAERDGHDFVAKAYAAGATGALVDRRVGSGPQALVDDSLLGLARMGVRARERVDACRAAVTGSVGKSSVKEAIAAIFRAVGSAHASEKSYNNHWGVPLSLARMPKGAKRAVFELGMNHAGEIAPLTEMVRPHVGVVTRLAPAHIEAFGSLEDIAAEKAQIWSAMADNGVAILPADDPLGDLLADLAKAHKVSRIVRFGVSPGADVRVTRFETGADGSSGQMDIFGQSHDFSLQVSGAHWAGNAAAAVAAALFCGVEAKDAAAALANLEPLPGRGGAIKVHLPGGEATLLDDAYNANPVSMAAAFDTLGVWPAKRRIAVLGDMLELGEAAQHYHEMLAWSLQNAGIDLVFCTGPLMHALYQSLPEARRGGWYENIDDLQQSVHKIVTPGDVVLFKGSNGSKIHQIANALKRALQDEA